MRAKTKTTGELFTPKEVSARLRVSVPTLKTWRYKRTGPAWKKQAGSVTYSAEAIEEWLQACHHDPLALKAAYM